MMVTMQWPFPHRSKYEDDGELSDQKLDDDDGSNDYSGDDHRSINRTRLHFLSLTPAGGKLEVGTVSDMYLYYGSLLLLKQIEALSVVRRMQGLNAVLVLSSRSLPAPGLSADSERVPSVANSLFVRH